MAEAAAASGPMALPAWGELEEHRKASKFNILNMFAEDPHRFDRFSKSFNQDEILLDYSKNLVSDKTMELLFDLVRQVSINICIACCSFEMVVGCPRSRRTYVSWRQDQLYRK